MSEQYDSTGSELDSTFTAEQESADSDTTNQVQKETSEQDFTIEDVEKKTTQSNQQDTNKESTKQGIINSYVKKLNEGQIEFDAIPKWIQKSLEQDQQTVDKQPEFNTENIKSEVLKSMKDEELFKSFEERIRGQKPNSSTQTEIRTYYQNLRDRGFGKGEALEMSYKMIYGATESSQRDVSRLKQGTHIPAPTKTGTQSVYNYSDLASMSQADFNRIKEAEKRGEVVININQ